MMHDKTDLSVTIESDIADRLAALAASRQTDPAIVAALAIERYLDEESAFRDFVQAGIDDIEAGRTHTQDEVEAWFAARYRDVAAE